MERECLGYTVFGGSTVYTQPPLYHLRIIYSRFHGQRLWSGRCGVGGCITASVLLQSKTAGGRIFKRVEEMGEGRKKRERGRE